MEKVREKDGKDIVDGNDKNSLSIVRRGRETHHSDRIGKIKIM